ncbi:hypothetical protein [Spirosoma validum]|uniref:Helix-turn-helix domain-containing protein n=1 Tax=Spirosoma validum TaxID=2771355 RepID=A0A927B7H8_9BACT|nr:hypothetical protein [Spirosoma validum]MBD2757130.1 hypothetical protein [Spirosoma validum]
MIDNPFAILQREINRIEAKQDAILELLRTKNTHAIPVEPIPILSAADVKKMTGWPNGTFYAKVAIMPEGIVIRNRSKRLLFNRARLLEWLQSSA